MQSITPFAAWLVLLRRGESEQFLMCTLLYRADDGEYPIQVVRPDMQDDLDVFHYVSDAEALEQMQRAVLATVAQYEPAAETDQLRLTALHREHPFESEDEFIGRVEAASGRAFTVHRTQR